MTWGTPSTASTAPTRPAASRARGWGWRWRGESPSSTGAAPAPPTRPAGGRAEGRSWSSGSRASRRPNPSSRRFTEVLALSQLALRLAWLHGGRARRGRDRTNYQKGAAMRRNDGTGTRRLGATALAVSAALLSAAALAAYSVAQDGDSGKGSEDQAGETERSGPPGPLGHPFDRELSA